MQIYISCDELQNVKSQIDTISYHTNTYKYRTNTVFDLLEPIAMNGFVLADNNTM
jgi:hypothetical protein